MKKLNNVLYVTSPKTYLSLNGETIVIKKGENVLKQIPLHNIEGIITFGYTGVSPALMGVCAKRNIALTFLSASGKFLARVCGEQYGNVVLRKEQYRVSDDENRSLIIAKNMIIAKLYNSKWVIERIIRDYSLRVDINKLKSVSQELSILTVECNNAIDLNQLRGFEGKGAVSYFSIFDIMILQQKDNFIFKSRNKRPPLDNVNALLSFVYTLLAHDCASAVEAVGLDAYVGFLHRDRPGRISLALDLMEEFRSVIADRFVLTLINKKIVSADGFNELENGAVIMDDNTRRIIITFWQKKKNEIIKHPFLKENVEWGIVPFVQAQLLARYLRGDLDAYPPFFWK
ncbi:MAG: type I-C CRISPR-associated endonuclease Cas1c [Anaerorhabdus sp.]|uniref:type I-C CRISPR-associated endonuclease Cas1c n=1 Tax=Anaerorhabdus sp. TaxID=1872524 RepID=UPI002FC89242